MASIWLSRPTPRLIQPLVRIGQQAPLSASLASSTSSRVIAFIRHVGCPFAENTVRQLREWAELHTDVAVFIVSHGSAHETSRWIRDIGGQGRLHVVVDVRRVLHGEWGVGCSSLSHFAGLPSILGVIALLRRGIRNRSAAGTRWQNAAMFLLIKDQVRWVHVPNSAQEFELPPALFDRLGEESP